MTIHLPIVLVLNRHWRPIDVKTPASAFCALSSGAAHALDIELPDGFTPTPWERWIQLPIRDGDRSVKTPRGAIRIPTVLISHRFARVPLRRPHFGLRGLYERDGGVCQYTGKRLTYSEASIDHVLPRSRGGRDSWENCVLAERSVNTKKGARLPQEAGLRLRTVPKAPRVRPASEFIRNTHSIPEWNIFLG